VSGTDGGGTIRSGALGALGLGVVLSAALVVVLDFSIVNVALPDISSELHISSSSVQWVVTAYAITFGGFLVLGGRAADLFGRRRIFVGGLIGFAIASAAGGIAADFPLLVISRAVQGMAAAAVAPAALSILTTSFHGTVRTRVLGYYGATASVGFVLGLVLGGILVQSAGWRAVFFVNVPICLLCAALGRRIRSDATTTGTRRLDLIGACLVTAGMATLVYAPTAGVDNGWSSVPFVAALATSVVLLTAFVVHERRTTEPLVPLTIFRSRTLAAGDAVTLLLGAWNAGEVLLLSLYLQHVLGYSPLLTGLAVVPQGVAGLVRGAVGASLVARLGIKRFLVASVVIAAVGLGLLLRFPSTSRYPLLGVVLFVVGFGTTSAAFGATVAGSSDVNDDDQGLAGALINAARQIGAALGVATLLSVAAAQSPSRSPAGLAAGYRTAMGVAAVLALAAGAISVAFVHDRACRTQQQRLRERRLDQPWPLPELLADRQITHG
jgi:EmrB/QacA subfamily drug resistance transporter